jgi:hypothetical protein
MNNIVEGRTIRKCSPSKADDSTRCSHEYDSNEIDESEL